jgi:predicted MPP superfamily phosphohydrolase
MSKNVEIALSLLANGFTVDELQSTLNINHQELNSILKTIRDLGYNYTKSFSSDGTILIKANRKLNLNPKEHVKVNVKDSTFHTLIISDLHIGGPYEKPRRLEVISDYAVSHDIHTIFNTGDLINNYYPEQEPDTKVKDPVEQAKRYLRYTPYKPNLIYFNLGGNHDFKSIIDSGFDSLRYYEDRRIDQISLGYGLCYVHLKGDTIALSHELKSSSNNINSTLIFKGHSHKFRNRNGKIIHVPAVTDNYKGIYEYVPLSGFLDAEFSFFDDKITRVNLKEILFANEELHLGAEETMVIRPDYEERHQKKLQKKKA